LIACGVEWEKLAAECKQMLRESGYNKSSWGRAIESNGDAAKMASEKLSIPRPGHGIPIPDWYEGDTPEIAEQRALTEEDTADYYDNAAHYDLLWGKDNIHIGYYPHFKDPLALELSFAQAGAQMTRHMIKLGNINRDSRVLDLGCGKGIGCREIAQLTGASCTGLDLSPGNISRANDMAKEYPGLSLDFVVGSFTDLPPSLVGKFTHVISQESFVHIHAELPAIWAQVKLAMAPGGVAVISDYLGSDGEVSETTRKSVYARLGFEMLLGHKDWRNSADDAGLTLKHYEDLDEHLSLAYEQLAEGAEKYAAQGRPFFSADGSPLAENYAQSANAARKHEIGLNLTLYVDQSKDLCGLEPGGC